MATLAISPAEALSRLQQDLGLSDGDLAAALTVSSRSLERWRVGATYPQHEGRARLVQLLALHDDLIAGFGDAEAARTWLRTPNHYLGQLTPIEVVRAGRLDRVAAALLALESGVYQ